MPSIWSKIKEYWQWFLWGKTPYNQLSDEMKRDARRDLYCRLFVIANAPYFATVYGTFTFSMAVATKMGDILITRVPEKESCRKSVGGMCFAVYIVLHVITMGAGFMYITVPYYMYIFNSLYSFGTSLYLRFQ
ncbi:Protein CBG23061 [Caenorhabditis briggsae]|uniref:Uncharacterized protein n=2 Tax=Caenorhabditis briggsae TaxID=6238 RepID=A0AAE9A0E8_CAEBR|nr:Protein CBG23061 [Caenorhabditis briggsae]ULT89367.1 hypothetical protein L3Y34_008082 [Caenorhabditis briggsae]UMM35188.1 hypothetical protein L5515_007927 [Caenorhabditis briggsae]CAP39900.1 Protein CBG23061 [Caenorhabditis briggsae]